ncbi:MAG: hypothetical protein ABI539_10375 [Acidobacteriota bacterium]
MSWNRLLTRDQGFAPRFTEKLCFSDSTVSFRGYAAEVSMARTIFLILFAFTLTTAAQSVRTPEKGSAERKAILGALRESVERDLKQPVVFAVEHFNVFGNWAFLAGSPQTAGGKAPDYRRTKYADAVDSGAFDNNIFGLLKRTAGKWRVVKHLIGCTDVCYATWWRDFRTPKNLFPYTE